MTIQEVFANHGSGDVIEINYVWVGCCSECHQYVEEETENGCFKGTLEDYVDYKTQCNVFEDTDEIEQIDDSIYRLCERGEDREYVCDKCQRAMYHAKVEENDRINRFLDRVLPKRKFVSVEPDMLKDFEDYKIMSEIVGGLALDEHRECGDYEISWSGKLITTPFGKLRAATFSRR